jgi:NAD(P)-dependent dehydrogenase (short-subunit alcohol dehydrogenase family)
LFARGGAADVLAARWNGRLDREHFVAGRADWRRGEWVHYAASKGAIDSFTIGLAREVASEGIRVNAVAPGLIETDLHADNGVPDRLKRLAPSIPMGRPGTPLEIAQGVLWLLSSAASYTTGTILEIGGGR